MRFALPFERDFARASSPVSDFVAVPPAVIAV